MRFAQRVDPVKIDACILAMASSESMGRPFWICVGSSPLHKHLVIIHPAFIDACYFPVFPIYV